jgi:hypothetical protein
MKKDLHLTCSFHETLQHLSYPRLKTHKLPPLCINKQKVQQNKIKWRKMKWRKDIGFHLCILNIKTKIVLVEEGEVDGDEKSKKKK